MGNNNKKLPVSAVASGRCPSQGLSFGVELEYVYAFYDTRSPGERQCETPTRDPAVNRIRSVLAEPLKGACKICSKRVSFQLSLDGQWEHSDLQGKYDVWSVDHDATVMRGTEADVLRKQEQNYGFVGVEIKSRVLGEATELDVNDGESSHVHVISYKEEISAVLRHLRQRFCDFGGERRMDYLYASKTCSLHVHISNRDRGFQVEDIKNLVSLNIACERQIDSIHARHRIDGSDYAMCPSHRQDVTEKDMHGLNDAFNVPVSCGFLRRAFHRQQCRNGLIKAPIGENGRYPGSDVNDRKFHDAVVAQDVDSWIFLVQNAPTIQSIHRDLYPQQNRNVNLNLTNICLEHYVTKPIPTIEFRQHEGTLQTERVLSYLDFISGMVRFCQSNRTAEVLKRISPGGCLRTPRTSLLDLCSTFDCEESTKSYFRDASTTEFIKQLRHDESRQARKAYSRDPLAALAARNLESEREGLIVQNRFQSVEEKFLCGGYGLWPRAYIDEVVPQGGNIDRLLGPEEAALRRKLVTLRPDNERRFDLESYSPLSYKLSNCHITPSAGSSACGSPSALHLSGNVEERGRTVSPGSHMTPSNSPFTLPGPASMRRRKSSSRASSSGSSVRYHE